jgi:hypothetical protein
MGSLIVCNWQHSVGKNHFFVKMLFNKDSVIQKCFQKIMQSLQVRKLGSLSAVRTTCHTVLTPICPKCQPSGRRIIPSGLPAVPSIIHLDDKNFLSGPSPMSRRFELLQLASVRTFQQPVRTTLSVRPSFRISFQNIDMGRLLQLSGRRGFPSGRAHPKGKYRNSNPDVRTPLSLVRTRVH